MTPFELWFLIVCAAGFLVGSWCERIAEDRKRDFERNRQDYGRNL